MECPDCIGKEQSWIDRFLTPILPSAVIVGCSVIPSGVISRWSIFVNISGWMGIMNVCEVSLS